MILAISIWYLIGFITCGYLVYAEGKLTIKDLFLMSIVAVIGPILPIGIWFMLDKDKVIWERKRD